MTLIPPRACHYCGDVFTPGRYGRSHQQRFCSRPCANRWRLQYDAARWQASQQKATRVSQARQRAKLAARFRDQFGPLSEREIDLVRVVREQSYNEGYSAGMAPLRKKGAA